MKYPQERMCGALGAPFGAAHVREADASVTRCALHHGATRANEACELQE